MPRKLSLTARPFLNALQIAIAAYGDDMTVVEQYHGYAEWLVLYGVGAPDRAPVRTAHMAKGNGRRAILWDLGYFHREKFTGHLRLSIDKDHPQDWFDATEPDPSRWKNLRIPLRETYSPNGPIVLVGLGPKSRSYLNEPSWEEKKLVELRARFPRKKILYRPKPSNPVLDLKADRIDAITRIEHVLNGASLVVCRHSNVAVDAAVAGVPFECEDGAAMWLYNKPFTRENRLDFLYRLAWWQWRATEAKEAWQFIRRIVPV